ncbi:MAG: prolyl oligopeptidase family serine peptidase [Tepidisphaeraceae bacterium]
MPIRWFAIPLVISACVAARAAQPATAPAGVTIGPCLVLGPMPRGGRASVPVDPIEAQVVAGTFRAPRDGDSVKAGASELRWSAIDAKDGLYSSPALEPGWAYVQVNSDESRVVMLHASAHTMVYVNGEPRVGDPYEAGYVHLPILLHGGINDLRLACSRGHLRVALASPAQDIFINPADVTITDGQEAASIWAGVVVVNATGREVTPMVSGTGGMNRREDRFRIPPLSLRKIPLTRFRDLGAAPEGERLDHVTVTLRDRGGARDAIDLPVRRREPGQPYKAGFISDIDHSVQYYAVTPAWPAPQAGEKPALVLSLHGAGVEAIGQADSYAPKPWCHIVCPTNRRPFGFDWEDWGRIDAMEVLDRAQAVLGTDPSRTYLTGHSMGGHGAWQLGVQFPGRFAAVGPSAGWLSFASYLRGPASRSATAPASQPTSVASIFRRAGLASDTPVLFRNLAESGVYILHGVDDDNVPVAQARHAAELLGGFHKNFRSHEQLGAGHWWDTSDEPGADCVDWPPMFGFFARHRAQRNDEVRNVSFITANPAINDRCHWARIDAQIRPLMLSSVELRCDPNQRRFIGKTENVARLGLSGGALPQGKAVGVVLDGQPEINAPFPASGQMIWLERVGDRWCAVDAPAPATKSAARSGPFKQAFANHMVFVYGTNGVEEENRATFAKARYDAEVWWYRANGSVEVIADKEFVAADNLDRNVILYGNADTNSAWEKVLNDCPIEVRRGAVKVGPREQSGDDLACLFVYPRSGSTKALVGVVSGTGPQGMRLTNRLAYFASGVAFPDWCVLGPEVLERGITAARGAGFFASDWSLSTEDSQGNRILSPPRA